MEPLEPHLQQANPAPSQPAPGSNGHQPAPAPSAPTAPLGSPTAAYVRTIFSASGASTLAWVAGAVFAAGLFGAGLLFSAVFAVALSEGSGSGGAADVLSIDFGQVIAGFLVLLGALLGGGIAIDAEVNAGLFAASGVVSARVIPFGIYALLIAGVALVAGLRMRHQRIPAPSLAAEACRSAVEGGLVAAFLAAITGLASFGGSAYFGGIAVRTQAPLVFLTVFFAVAATLWLTRALLQGRAVGAFARGWAASLREAAWYLTVQGVVFAAVALVVLVIASVHVGNGAPVLAGSVLLGNFAVAAAALGQFGGLTAGTSSAGSMSVTVFDAPDGHGAWLPVSAVVVIVVASTVVGVRRPRTDRPEWRRVWQMPLVVFGGWCALALGIVGVHVDGEVSAAMQLGLVGSVGLSWTSPFLAGIAAGVASVGAEFIPLVLFRINPALLTVLGGRRAAQLWLHGTRVPEPATPSAAFPAPAASNPQAQHPQQPSPAEQNPQAWYTPPVGAGAPASQPNDAAADAPAAAPHPALAPPKPMSRKARERLIVSLSVAGVLAVLAIASAATVAIVNQSRDPAAMVSQYLQLLEAGKADEATRLVDPGLQTSDRALLTDEVLGAAEQRIEVVRVETTSRAEGTANVHVTYALDGERFEAELLVEQGPKEYLVLDTWELREPLLVSATLTGPEATSLTLGTSEVPLERNEYGGSASREVYVYPGVYTVTTPTNEYLQSSTEQLRAAVGHEAEPAVAEVTVKPSARFEAEVLQQVQQRITQCVTIPTNMDDACPYVTQDTDLAEMKVVQQPEGFEDISLTHFTSLEGKIAVRQNPSSWIKEPSLRESDVTVRGEIEFEKGKPKITEINVGGW